MLWENTCKGKTPLFRVIFPYNSAQERSKRGRWAFVMILQRTIYRGMGLNGAGGDWFGFWVGFACSVGSRQFDLGWWWFRLGLVFLKFWEFGCRGWNLVKALGSARVGIGFWWEMGLGRLEISGFVDNVFGKWGYARLDMIGKDWRILLGTEEGLVFINNQDKI